MTDVSVEVDSKAESRDPVIEDGCSNSETPWYLETFFTNFMAGAASSAITEMFMAPFERVKLLLQLQNSAKKFKEGARYKGIFATFKRVYVEQGVLSFWRGNSASLMRCLPYQALNFSLKDKFREIVNASDGRSNFSTHLLTNLVSGGLAGSCALAVIYPFDYARTRLAVETGKGKNREFRTVRQTLIQTYKADGRLGLYRGFYCSIIGVFVYRSVYFGIFDTGYESRPPEYQNSLWYEFVLADLAGVIGSTVSYPFDTVRRSMMMQSGSGVKRYRNYRHCCTKIYRKQGFRGFYQGGFINGVRGLGGALMLVLYERIQTYFTKLNPHACKVSDKFYVDSHQCLH